MGRYTIKDCGGRSWKIEYNLLEWKSEWNDWNFYSSSDTQRDLFDDISRYCFDNLDTYAVEVVLLCETEHNRSVVFYLDGTKYDKYKEK